MPSPTISKCCVTGSRCDSVPSGEEITFPTSTGQAYVAGSNSDVAILLVHGLASWKLPNMGLLADHYARKVGAMVYLPDLGVNRHHDVEQGLTGFSFGGKMLDMDELMKDPSEWKNTEIWFLAD